MGVGGKTSLTELLKLVFSANEFSFAVVIVAHLLCHQWINQKHGEGLCWFTYHSLYCLRYMFYISINSEFFLLRTNDFDCEVLKYSLVPCYLLLLLATDIFVSPTKIFSDSIHFT